MLGEIATQKGTRNGTEAGCLKPEAQGLEYRNVAARDVLSGRKESVGVIAVGDGVSQRQHEAMHKACCVFGANDLANDCFEQCFLETGARDMNCRCHGLKPSGQRWR